MLACSRASSEPNRRLPPAHGWHIMTDQPDRRAEKRLAGSVSSQGLIFDCRRAREGARPAWSGRPRVGSLSEEAGMSAEGREKGRKGVQGPREGLM
jgi:hypothetical protein